MYTDDGVDLDAEVVELLRRAAGELPGYAADRTAVARRRTARQRRHVAVAVAAGLAVIVLIGGVALLGPGHRAAPPEVAANPPAAPRLFIAGGGFSWAGAKGRQVGLSPTDDLGEVLPDGHLITRRIPGLPAVRQAVALPDGGFAALGSRTPTEPFSIAPPGASPTPASVAGPYSVAVVRPDGSVRFVTDTTASVLLGADDQRVYLWGAGTIALDLATGRQQSLAWLGLHANAVLAAGRFAELSDVPMESPPQQPCTLWLLDAHTGAQTSTRPLPPNDCYRDATALSPDGQWLAIAQPGPFTGGNINQLSVVLVNLDTGDQTNQVLDQGPVGGSGNVTFQGMAWLNDYGVRVVWTHLPDHVDRMYDRSEVLRMKTVTVPGQ